MTTSNVASANGNFSSSPVRELPPARVPALWPAAALRASSPDTWAPRSAAIWAAIPAPQPASRYVIPGPTLQAIQNRFIHRPALALLQFCPIAGARTPQGAIHRAGSFSACGHMSLHQSTWMVSSTRGNERTAYHPLIPRDSLPGRPARNYLRHADRSWTGSADGGFL